MNIFTELGNLYLEIDSQYKTQELEAHENNLIDKEQELVSKRELNNHAYYLFMFSRFEDFIREQSSLLITTEQNSSLDWKQRRAWNILPKDKMADTIPFLNRVELLIDKGSHHYQKIQNYYKLRNKLAHGGNFDSPISIPTVVADFEVFHNAFRVS